MGRSQAGRIARGLMHAGMPAETAAVAIENATTPASRHRFSQLADLESAVAALDQSAPVLLLVGDAVGEAPGWREGCARPANAALPTAIAG